MAKHKGWTPAITARAEENKKNKYMCKECQKCFYCKSNLNRHVAKVHKNIMKTIKIIYIKMLLEILQKYIINIMKTI